MFFLFMHALLETCKLNRFVSVTFSIASFFLVQSLTLSCYFEWAIWWYCYETGI